MNMAKLYWLGAFLLFSQWAVAEGDESVAEMKTDSVLIVSEETDKDRCWGLMFCPDITEFENDEIPVDSALFFSHVQSLEFQIPLDFNSEVKRFIDYFGTSWQPKLKEMITLSQYYFPIYESILDKNNLPLELKYVSVIESALNPYAVSRSGAVGLWQFMPYTGKLYHLQIDRYQDERRDVYKSTEAACGYFSDMSKIFDDWLVVIASYNCGPGNIRKAINRAGGKTGFWDIYPYLPSQTQHYIPSFIAVAYLMNFYEHYGIFPTEVSVPRTDILEVNCSKDFSLKAIAQVLEISEADIKKLNPSLKGDVIPQNVEDLKLKLPEDLAYKFIENQEEILRLSNEYKAEVKEVIYVVKRGDSLPAIANHHGCSVTEIKDWNNLSSNLIHPGKRLKLYL
ncbi:MAG: transglycosylase SLT domain-containing protein [Bacteroidetes bacterium]|nr:transglycosylase SLT domain-containing protein [Bacteroidota bacterium]